MSAATSRRRRARRSALWWRARTYVKRHLLYSDGFTLLVLSLCAGALGVLFTRDRGLFPLSMLALVVLAGGFLLSVRSLLLLDVVVAAVVVFDLVRVDDVAKGAIIVVAGTAAMVHLLARSRGRLGVQGTRGDSMLVDLRDRLTAQGEMPALPDGWSAEIVLRSAGGASFSGDFLVATRSDDGTHVEVALVDVSGKGVDAGTRALLLSGAFGGLLGSVPHEEFLPATNRYLIRQHWEEGFATVAHVVIDLATGEYVVSVAGHPPAVHFTSGSGRWRVSEASEGPLLGIFPDAKFVSERGRLERGDALLMFTDGLIEKPGQDIAVGIDKLLGEAERLVTRGFRHGARKLIDRVAAAHNDDRAVVLIWRD
ncbi:MAG TPA: PP2C family protein-serine/threonine phosphatase [Actinomycetes bacterium]|nr:PP2C family protein-serine/threonine phosphatase [Actinomycetes bacterium]